MTTPISPAPITDAEADEDTHPGTADEAAEDVAALVVRTERIGPVASLVDGFLEGEREVAVDWVVRFEERGGDAADEHDGEDDD